MAMSKVTNPAKLSAERRKEISNQLYIATESPIRIVPYPELVLAIRDLLAHISALEGELDHKTKSLKETYEAFCEMEADRDHSWRRAAEAALRSRDEAVREARVQGMRDAAEIARSSRTTIIPKLDESDEIWEASCNNVAQDIATAIERAAEIQKEHAERGQEGKGV